MTILTKSTDKKKLLPIPTAPIAPASSISQLSDAEAARIIHARHRARATTLLVFLMAVLVLLMGVLAGVCFYRQYLREKVQRLECLIPYSNDVGREENFWVNTRWRDGAFSDSLKMDKNEDDITNEEAASLKNMLSSMLEEFQRDFNNPMKEMRDWQTDFSDINDDTVQKKWFKEELEIKDDNSDSYADITIPDFRDGRKGRFIHDYKNNQTTIVDGDANRCFIYPLDYEVTLPPRSMADVFIKMQTGYYFPDTNVLRKKMRVVVPELDHEDDYISLRTLDICNEMKIYRLEPFVSGVFKRSIADKLGDHASFAEYAGKQIVTYDFMNLNEVEQYENGKIAK
ncbi:CLUMA_CG014168, isoform A [Clunio marinus]|uniref:Integral membrane protein 2 n=1 Tax=Clunio marinus TaxID=568069 RepID=A0A1J1IL35_9DIPT|nr:CLUMA_CG014168, isoform A [Clunio marinus]